MPSRRGALSSDLEGVALDAGGELLGRLEIYRDVTGQRLVQSKLLQTEKMAGLNQLVSGIAHELE